MKGKSFKSSNYTLKSQVGKVSDTGTKKSKRNAAETWDCQ